MKPRHALAVLVALLVLALTAAAAAAATPGRPWKANVVGGIGIAKLRNVDDPLGVLESVNSFAFGGGVAMDVGEGLAIEPQIMYIPKGISFGKSNATDDAGNVIGDVTVQQVINEIEFPILLRYTFPLQSRFHPSIAMGPFFSIEASEKLEVTGAIEDSEDTHVFKNSDMGITFAAGLGTDLGPGRWIVDFRYDLGLANLGNFYSVADTHSGAFLIMTGYSF